MVLSTLMVSLPGTELPDVTAARLREGLAGVILFARNFAGPAQLARLCAEIRAHRPDALIACDEEGGEVTRLQAREGSSWPGARVLGVVDDVALTRRAGEEIGRALAGCGVNVNLAPVADVLDAETSSVIGNRSFGEDPALVGRHVAAFVRGTQATGVAACAKHFPGHGPATVDSHLQLPVVSLDRDSLIDRHVAPFADAVAAGVAMLMSAHVVYTRVDPDAPATASAPILTGLARDALGFDGVIVTDALNMKAISDHLGVASGALAALGAGADLLCVDGDLDVQADVIARVERALRDGTLDPGRVARSAQRVQALAAAVDPRGPGATPAAAAAAARVRAAAARAGAGETSPGLQAARRALRTRPLPAPLTATPYVIEAGGRRSGVAEVRTHLLDALRRRDPAATGEAFTADVVPAPETVLAAAGARPLVIGCRDAGARPAQRALVDALLRARPDAILVALGAPVDAGLAPRGRAVAALGSAPPNLDAVAEVLVPGGPPAPAA